MLPAALLWGSGTAIGEIPPYAFSYHAAKAGIRNEEWDSMFQVKPAREGQGLFEGALNAMKAWMLGFIQRCARPGLPVPSSYPPIWLMLLCMVDSGSGDSRWQRTKQLLLHRAVPRLCCSSHAPRPSLPCIQC